MSIQRVTNEFLNGASILETRQELMRLGWSAERTNGWLLKAMRFQLKGKDDGIQIDSQKSKTTGNRKAEVGNLLKVSRSPKWQRQLLPRLPQEIQPREA